MMYYSDYLRKAFAYPNTIAWREKKMDYNIVRHAIDSIKSQKKDFINEYGRIKAELPTLLSRNGFILESFLAWQLVDENICPVQVKQKKLEDLYNKLTVKQQEAVTSSYSTFFSKPQVTYQLSDVFSVIFIFRRYVYDYKSFMGLYEITVSTQVNNSQTLDSGNYTCTSPEEVVKYLKVLDPEVLYNDFSFEKPKSNKLLKKVDFKKFIVK